MVPGAIEDHGLDKIGPGGDLAVMTNNCHPSIWEVKAGDQEFRASFGYIVKFKDSPGYVRPCLKTRLFQMGWPFRSEGIERLEARRHRLGGECRELEIWSKGPTWKVTFVQEGTLSSGQWTWRWSLGEQVISK